MNVLKCEKLYTSASPRGRLANCAAEDGATPLFLAAQEGHTDCLRLLLQHGADANLTSLEPVALPLHAALQFAHVQYVYLLLFLLAFDASSFQSPLSPVLCLFFFNLFLSMAFRITSLHLSFCLPTFRCPITITSIFCLLIQSFSLHFCSF